MKVYVTVSVSNGYENVLGVFSTASRALKAQDSGLCRTLVFDAGDKVNPDVVDPDVYVYYGSKGDFVTACRYSSLKYRDGAVARPLKMFIVKLDLDYNA